MADYYLHGTGLWLPYPPRQAPATRGSLDFMCVNLSHEQAFGEAASWEGIQRELAPYSLELVVEVLSRVAIALHHSDGPIDLAVQGTISKGLFGPQITNDLIETARAVDEAAQDHGGASPILLFHEQQVLSLLKVALLTKDSSEGGTGGDLIGIGKALLMAADLASEGPTKLSSLDQSDPEYLGRWLQYIVANGLFTADDVAPYALARCHDLYLSEHAGLKDRDVYIDLPQRVRQVTGLSPEMLWGATLALNQHWARMKLEEIGTVQLWLDQNRYFTELFDVSAEESELIFETCAVDVAQLQAQVRARYSLDDIKPFDVLPFARTPLVSFEGHLRPVSLNLLLRKLTTGLYHIHIDPSVPSPGRALFQTFSGDILSHYVDLVFGRMFSTHRYVILDEMRAEFRGSYADGVIVYPDGLIVVETKASLFSLEARVGGDLEQLESRFRDIYFDGATQLNNTIAELRGGIRDEAGRIPDQIRWFQPMIVTLEETPMNPLTYGALKRLIEPAGLLNAGDIRELQVLTVSELEAVESIVTSGAATLEALIEEKLSSGPEADDSWSNFLYRRRDRFGNCQNRHLQERASALVDGALKLFEQRRRA